MHSSATKDFVIDTNDILSHCSGVIPDTNKGAIARRLMQDGYSETAAYAKAYDEPEFYD